MGATWFKKIVSSKVRVCDVTSFLVSELATVCLGRQDCFYVPWCVVLGKLLEVVFIRWWRTGELFGEMIANLSYLSPWKKTFLINTANT